MRSSRRRGWPMPRAKWRRSPRPLHKASLWLSGHKYARHTGNARRTVRSRRLRHDLYSVPRGRSRAAGLAWRNVTCTFAGRCPGSGSNQKAFSQSQLVDRFMTAIKGSRPRMECARSSPHAGERGLFRDRRAADHSPAVECGLAEGPRFGRPASRRHADVANARDGQYNAWWRCITNQGPLCHQCCSPCTAP